MAAGLYLIGIGPGGIDGMTREAISVAKSADVRRYEAYTALWEEGAITELEEEIGEIVRVMRPEIEEPSGLFSLAATAKVALLVVGDPLQATTHVDLQLRALESGIACHVIHGISITGVVTGAVGLSNYRFGRQTTLTYPYGEWVATSPLEVIALNRSQGLHTLVLLDLDPTGAGTGEQRPMQPLDAAKSLRTMASKLESEIEHMQLESNLDRLKVEAAKGICEDIDALPVVLCTDMGTLEQRILNCSVSTLGDAQEGRLHCLIIPANTSEIETKALQRWSK
jgi:diphthine synthase